jgi:hypothetical protein
MSNINVILEEIESDIRSNQATFKLTATDNSDAPIRLLSIEPRLPLTASLIDITDRSLAQSKSQQLELISSLNLITEKFIWNSTSSFRETWISLQTEAVGRVFPKGSTRFLINPMGHMAELFYNRQHFEDRFRREMQSISYKIYSIDDARVVFAKFINNGAYYKTDTEKATNQPILSLYSAKLEQLEAVESRMEYADRRGLLSLDPLSSYSSTYVVSFQRGFLEPSRYQIAFDLIYDRIGPSGDTPEHSIASTSSYIRISPSATALSIVSMLGAYLGVLLKKPSFSEADSLGVIHRSFELSQSILSSSIIALVFFNVYEHTNLSRRLDMPISWRSALLIGVLCGLSHERIIASIQSLIGT